MDGTSSGDVASRERASAGDLAYGSLVAALGSDADVAVKDLEVYASPEAPADYSLDLEVEGVLDEADELGWGRFHLAGYSGGGTAALAVMARHSGAAGEPRSARTGVGGPVGSQHR